MARQLRKEVAKPSPIRLVLKTTKQEYQVGEPVTITAYLENLSESSYYVGNTLVRFWGTVGLHELRLSILGNDGEVKIGRGGGAWIWKPGTTTPEKVAQTYVELRPNGIHGLTESTKLPIGRYRLIATYREREATSWPEKDLRDLQIPVWTRELVSNSVSIRIRPRTR